MLDNRRANNSGRKDVGSRLHICWGDAWGVYRELPELVKKGGSYPWKFRESAKKGDRVFFYTPYAFLGQGRLLNNPVWRGEHLLGQVGDLELLPKAVTLKEARQRFPNWRYLKNVRGPIEVPKDIAKDLINLLTRKSTIPPPVATDRNPPRRKQTYQITRIIRDSILIRELKVLHADKCQICGKTLYLANGKPFSEGHHVKPLSDEHKGPDVRENILILCPNDHALCDYSAIHLNASKIKALKNHRIDPRYIAYHNKLFLIAK